MSVSKGIICNDVDLQFISNKKNLYDVEYYYFRIVSKDIQNRLRPYFKVSETLVSPIFKSNDDQKYFVKVKSNCIPKTIFNKSSIYTCDINFVSYGDFTTTEGTKPPVGYYAVLLNSIERVEKEEDNSD